MYTKVKPASHTQHAFRLRLTFANFCLTLLYCHVLQQSPSLLTHGYLSVFSLQFQGLKCLLEQNRLNWLSEMIFKKSEATASWWYSLLMQCVICKLSKATDCDRALNRILGEVKTSIGIIDQQSVPSHYGMPRNGIANMSVKEGSQ